MGSSEVGMEDNKGGVGGVSLKGKVHKMKSRVKTSSSGLACDRRHQARRKLLHERRLRPLVKDHPPFAKG